MPNGKPAGVRCVQLTADNRCAVFGLPERPLVCVRLQAEEEMCGQTSHEAYVWFREVERLTAPSK